MTRQWLFACTALVIAAFGPQGTDRIVVAELFTGSECGPCAAADGGFDKILREYDRDEVVVLEYHIDIPVTDPMSTKETQARADYYMFGSAAAPTAYFDGAEAYRGGGPRGWDGRYFNRVQRFIAEAFEKAPEFVVNVGAGQGFSAATIRVNVRSFEPPGDEDLRLHIIIYEDGVDYAGFNKITVHRNVVRMMVEGPGGIPVALEDGVQEVVRLLPREVVSNPDFGVVVFVQRRRSYEILQARELRFGPELPDARQLHDEGVGLAREGNFDGAIEKLAEAVTVDPEAALGHYTLGMAYAGKRMLDEAAFEWEKSLELDPEQPEIHARISIVYEDAGNREAAIQHLEMFLEKAPDHPQAGPQRERLRKLKRG